MNGLEIEEALRRNVHTKDRFIGVFSSDTIPLHPTRNTCFVTNTDPQHLPGQHWVAFYVSEIGRVYYFDSFGLPPLSASFISFVRLSTGRWQRNRKQLQSITASTCGPHCIHFLIEACRSRNPRKSLLQMSRNSHPRICDRVVSQRLLLAPK